MPILGSRSLWTSAVVALDDATIAWVAAVVANGGSVSDARKTIVNTLIAGLKSDDLWIKLDRLWLLAAENTASALTDLVGLTLASEVSSPTFTTDRGYAGNGTTSYINTVFNASTQGVNYQLNSASIHVWDSTNRAEAFVAACGAADTNNSYIIPLDSGPLAYHSLNNGGASRSTGTQSDGFFSNIRAGAGSSSSDQLLYRNGSILSFVVGAAAGAIPAVEFYVCGYNLSNSLALATTDQIAAFAAGGVLNATEAGNLYSRLRTYMTAVGVP